MSRYHEHKAFVFSTGADTAGCAVRIAQAFRGQEKSGIGGACPELNPGFGWEVRSMVSSDNYIHYPIDLPYNRSELLFHYDAADLVHMNSTLAGHHWYDRGQGKPTIIMHHGFHYDHFSQTIHEVVAEAAEIGATQVGSTVNLELLAPLGPPGPTSVTWTPTPYNLPTLADMRRTLYQPHPAGLIRVAHAPTDRAVKSTEAFISAMSSLKSRGFPVEMVLIERQTWAETMQTKAKSAEILVDQLNLGYGCNAIEAWALGIPVIGAVNAHPDWRAHMQARFGLEESPTGLPMLETDENGLEKAIATLVMSEAARFAWATIGRAHVERHHSEVAVVKLLSSIYDEVRARGTRPSEIPPRRGLKGVSQVEKLGELRRIRALQRKEEGSQP
jgi:hypothetical protein